MRNKEILNRLGMSQKHTKRLLDFTEISENGEIEDVSGLYPMENMSKPRGYYLGGTAAVTYGGAAISKSIHEISGWFKIDSSIIGSGREGFFLRGSGVLQFSETFTSGNLLFWSHEADGLTWRQHISTNNFNDDQWHFVYQKYDPENLKMWVYVDNVLEIEIDYFANDSVLTSSLSFNGLGTGSADRFAGWWTDIRAYHRDNGYLTEQELYHIQNFDLVADKTVLHFKCEEGSGLISHDSAWTDNLNPASRIKGTINFNGLDNDEFHVEIDDLHFPSWRDRFGFSEIETVDFNISDVPQNDHITDNAANSVFVSTTTTYGVVTLLQNYDVGSDFEDAVTGLTGNYNVRFNWQRGGQHTDTLGVANQPLSAGVDTTVRLDTGFGLAGFGSDTDGGFVQFAMDARDGSDNGWFPTGMRIYTAPFEGSQTHFGKVRVKYKNGDNSFLSGFSQNAALFVGVGGASDTFQINGGTAWNLGTFASSTTTYWSTLNCLLLDYSDGTGDPVNGTSQTIVALGTNFISNSVYHYILQAAHDHLNGDDTLASMLHVGLDAHPNVNSGSTLQEWIDNLFLPTYNYLNDQLSFYDYDLTASDYLDWLGARYGKDGTQRNSFTSVYNASSATWSGSAGFWQITSAQFPESPDLDDLQTFTSDILINKYDNFLKGQKINLVGFNLGVFATGAAPDQWLKVYNVEFLADDGALPAHNNLDNQDIFGNDLDSPDRLKFNAKIEPQACIDGDNGNTTIQWKQPKLGSTTQANYTIKGNFQLNDFNYPLNGKCVIFGGGESDKLYLAVTNKTYEIGVRNSETIEGLFSDFSLGLEPHSFEFIGTQAANLHSFTLIIDGVTVLSNHQHDSLVTFGLDTLIGNSVYGSNAKHWGYELTTNFGGLSSRTLKFDLSEGDGNYVSSYDTLTNTIVTLKVLGASPWSTTEHFASNYSRGYSRGILYNGFSADITNPLLPVVVAPIDKGSVIDGSQLEQEKFYDTTDNDVQNIVIKFPVDRVANDGDTDGEGNQSGVFGDDTDNDFDDVYINVFSSQGIISAKYIVDELKCDAVTLDIDDIDCDNMGIRVTSNEFVYAVINAGDLYGFFYDESTMMSTIATDRLSDTDLQRSLDSIIFGVDGFDDFVATLPDANAPLGVVMTVILEHSLPKVGSRSLVTVNFDDFTKVANSETTYFVDNNVFPNIVDTVEFFTEHSDYLSQQWFKIYACILRTSDKKVSSYDISTGLYGNVPDFKKGQMPSSDTLVNLNPHGFAGNFGENRFVAIRSLIEKGKYYAQFNQLPEPYWHFDYNITPTPTHVSHGTYQSSFTDKVFRFKMDVMIPSTASFFERDGVTPSDYASVFGETGTFEFKVHSNKRDFIFLEPFGGTGGYTVEFAVDQWEYDTWFKIEMEVLSSDGFVNFYMDGRKILSKPYANSNNSIQVSQLSGGNVSDEIGRANAEFWWDDKIYNSIPMSEGGRGLMKDVTNSPIIMTITDENGTNRNIGGVADDRHSIHHKYAYIGRYRQTFGVVDLNDPNVKGVALAYNGTSRIPAFTDDFPAVGQRAYLFETKQVGTLNWTAAFYDTTKFYRPIYFKGRVVLDVPNADVLVDQPLSATKTKINDGEWEFEMNGFSLPFGSHSRIRVRTLANLTFELGYMIFEDFQSLEGYGALCEPYSMLININIALPFADVETDNRDVIDSIGIEMLRFNQLSGHVYN